MRLVKLPRADGTNAYINPLLVRAVVVNDKLTSMIQFDNDHVIMVRETADKVAERIGAVMSGGDEQEAPGGDGPEGGAPSGPR